MIRSIFLSQGVLGSLGISRFRSNLVNSTALALRRALTIFIGAIGVDHSLESANG